MRSRRSASQSFDVSQSDASQIIEGRLLRPGQDVDPTSKEGVAAYNHGWGGSPGVEPVTSKKALDSKRRNSHQPSSAVGGGNLQNFVQ